MLPLLVKTRYVGNDTPYVFRDIELFQNVAWVSQKLSFLLLFLVPHTAALSLSLLPLPSRSTTTDCRRISIRVVTCHTMFINHSRTSSSLITLAHTSSSRSLTLHRHRSSSLPAPALTPFVSEFTKPPLQYRHASCTLARPHDVTFLHTLSCLRPLP